MQSLILYTQYTVLYIRQDLYIYMKSQPIEIDVSFTSLHFHHHDIRIASGHHMRTSGPQRDCPIVRTAPGG